MLYQPGVSPELADALVHPVGEPAEPDGRRVDDAGGEP